MSNPAFEFDHIHIISRDPQASAQWYVHVFGAEIVADTVARGAPQTFVSVGGRTIIMRGQCPRSARPVREYADFASHNQRCTDHFGFLYHGHLRDLCAKLRDQGVRFPVPLKMGVGGKLLCQVAAPDGVSIELTEP